MKSFSVYKAVFWGVVCVLLSSCTSLNGSAGRLFNAGTDITLTFRVASDINPDESRRPSPLFIRLYELKSPNQFSKADFISLYERDKEVLGADMLAKQELKRLKPGEDRVERITRLSDETRYVGLYAEFLDYRKASYKVVIDVTPNNLIDNKAIVNVSGNIISAVRK